MHALHSFESNTIATHACRWIEIDSGANMPSTNNLQPANQPTAQSPASFSRVIRADNIETLFASPKEDPVT